MEVTSTTSTGSADNFVDPSEIGFAGLTADDFMTLLITELQNQDPSEPLKNEDLLSQLSMMQNLQANVELSDSLQAFATNQQLSTAANFIGKSITGFSDSAEEVAGVVDRAFLRDGTAYVGVGDAEVSLTNVIDVTAA